MDIASFAAIEKLRKFLPEEQGTPRFGLGTYKKEKQCEYITVFMTSFGRTAATTERYRQTMAPNKTPLDARDEFSAKKASSVNKDQFIADENNFELSSKNANEPLSRLSNNCMLNLNLLYSTSVVGSAYDKITGLI